MSAIPLGQYLILKSRSDEAEPSCRPTTVSAVREAEDGVTQLAEARAEGEIVGLEKGRRELKEALVKAEQEFAIALAANRSEWGDSVGLTLRHSVEAELATIRDDLAVAVCEVLAPVVRAGILERLVSEFRENCRQLLADSSAANLTIRVPEWLAGSIEKAFSGMEVEVHAVEDDTHISALIERSRLRADISVIALHLKDFSHE